MVQEMKNFQTTKQVQFLSASFLVACKSDLHQAVPESEIQRAMHYYPHWLREYIAVSGETGHNVDKLMNMLTCRLVREFERRFPVLNEPPKQGTKPCLIL